MRANGQAAAAAADLGPRGRLIPVLRVVRVKGLAWHNKERRPAGGNVCHSKNKTIYSCR